MSNEKQTPKKTVRIKEGHLVDLIDKIVSEAVAIKKKEWLAEQAVNKNTVLENKIASLEKKLNAMITEAKK